MTRPSRATTSGRAYLDLLARARREGRPADELLTLYVLERFLYRLSVSAHRDRLVLKGGMLLSAFGRRRPTRDIDLLARTISNEPAAVAALVREIAAVQADDGIVYETGQMTTRTIREQDLYAAVRVAVPARVDRARQPLRIDVNVGDPVTPAPTVISYPALLGEPFPLLAYPIEAVLAEKLVTIVARGDDHPRPGLRRRPPARRTSRHRCCQPVGRHHRHGQLPQDRVAPRRRYAADAGPGQASRMAAPDHPSRARRPPAIRLHRGDPAAHSPRPGCRRRRAET